MYDDQVTKKQKDYAKELASFSPQEIEKIERICHALEKRFNAEAAMESQQKFRILFQRSAKEWLPFIIYCLTFAPVAGVSVYRIVELKDWWQIAAWVALIFIMAMPILASPFLHKSRVESSNDTKDNAVL